MEEETRGRPLSAPQSIAMGFSFNKNLASNLTYWRNAVLNQDMDFGAIVDGGEGGGKSVLGMQVAKFMDKDHHIDLPTQVCWYPDQFTKAVTTLGKGKAIVWDEARRGLNRRRSTQEVNISMTDMLAECRQHNLFLIIIMPSFYDMDMYAAVWRTRILLHVWYRFNTENKEFPLERGFFRFYNEEGKKRLYTNPLYRKGYHYPYIKNESFDATFSHHYVVDENAYRQSKKEAEAVYHKKAKKDILSVEDVIKIKQRTIGGLCRFLTTNQWLKRGGVIAVAKRYGVTQQTIHEWSRNAQEGDGVQDASTLINKNIEKSPNNTIIESLTELGEDIKWPT